MASEIKSYNKIFITLLVQEIQIYIMCENLKDFQCIDFKNIYQKTQAVNQDYKIWYRKINVTSGLSLKSQKYPEEMDVLAISALFSNPNLGTQWINFITAQCTKLGVCQI